MEKKKLIKPDINDKKYIYWNKSAFKKMFNNQLFMSDCNKYYEQQEAKPIPMICEYDNCLATQGQDYINPNPEKGWENEPIYLCDFHARKMKCVLFVIS